MSLSRAVDPAVRSASLALVREAILEIDESIERGVADHSDEMAQHIAHLSAQRPGASTDRLLIADMARFVALQIYVRAGTEAGALELLETFEVATLDWPNPG